MTDFAISTNQLSAFSGRGAKAERGRWRSSQFSVMGESKDLPGELFGIFKQVRDLKDLQPNWDSYGALQVSNSAVDAAINLLTELRWTGPLPSVAPTASGGVHLEWGGDEEGVEVTIGPNGAMTVLLDVAGRMHEATVGGPTDPFLNEALGWAAGLAY
jgi:hypothetical protein